MLMKLEDLDAECWPLISNAGPICTILSRMVHLMLLMHLQGIDAESEQ